MTGWLLALALAASAAGAAALSDAPSAAPAPPSPLPPWRYNGYTRFPAMFFGAQNGTNTTYDALEPARSHLVTIIPWSRSDARDLAYFISDALLLKKKTMVPE